MLTEPAIVVGEVVAYRGWRLAYVSGTGLRLRSLAIRWYYYQPREIAYGGFPDRYTHGIYAVKTKRQLRALLGRSDVQLIVAATTAGINGASLVNLAMGPGLLLSALVLFSLFATIVGLSLLALDVRVGGRVALSGRVVEHERGYRAEFARIVAIDKVYAIPPPISWLVRRRLRRIYGLR